MNLTGVLISVGVLIFAMVMHELAHGLAAFLLGDTTAKEEGRLSLNPIDHVDPMMSIFLPLMMIMMGGPIFGGAKPVPVNENKLKWREYGMALVALAGPMMNFLIAFLSFLIFFHTGWILTEVGGMLGWKLVMVNLSLMVFNLLPLPPLDGSRILYALMPDGVRAVMRRIEESGMAIVLVIVLASTPMLGRLVSGAMTGILQMFKMVAGL